MPISFIPYTAVYGPLSLPGTTCQLWLDGADPLGNNSVPANGATVSTWVDKSRNGRNATGGVSPTYNTSQKAIVFNGSSWLTTSYSSVPTNETIFIVYQTTSSAVGANCFMIGPSDFLLGGRLILTVNENDGFGLSFKIGSYGVANGSRLTMAQNQMYIGTTTVASTTSYVYLNGTQGPSSTLTYSGTGTTQIGTAASGSAIYIGYIYEIVIYNTNLTTPQQQSIEGYLAQKWGLTSQLPPGHQGLRQTLYNGKVYQPQISLKPAPYANYYPLSLAGCQLWLDAADSTSIVSGYLRTNGVVTTLAGSGGATFADGTGTGASFNRPNGLAVIPSSGLIVVADTFNHRIRLLNRTTGVVTTLAGSGSPAFADGTGAGASFFYPFGVCVLSNGNIVVADTFNNRIRLVTTSTYEANSGVVTTLAGSSSAAFADGTGATASFNTPTGVAVIPSSGLVVIADQGSHRIRLLDPTTGIVTTLAGSGSPAFADGTGAAASFYNPDTVAVTSSGVIVIGDFNNHRIRLVTTSTYAANSGVVTTLAGSGSPAFADGTGAAASFNSPRGVAVLANGNIVVADMNNHRIRLVTPLGIVTTLAGSGSPTFADGTGAGASFNTPIGIAVIPSSGLILVGDYNNHRIRLITSATEIIWIDKSGNGYNGTSGAGPIYTTDAQGRKCMSFTGTQFLESVVTVSKQNHSLIAVHAPTYTNGFNNSGSTLGGNSSLFRFQIPANAGGYIVFPFWYNAPLGYVSNYGTTNGALPDNSVAGAASIINANIGPQTQYSYKNGIQQGTESASLVTGTTPPLTIGRYTPGLSEYYQGYVYEMIIYNTALTTTQRQNIEGYLAWKWGLQGSLINHPYSSAPPLQYTRGAILPPPTLNAFGRVAYASMTPYYNVTPQTWLSVWQPYLQELVAANSGATASLSSTGASVTSTNTGAAIIAPNGNIYYSVVGSSISYYNPTTNAVNSIALGQAIDSPSAVLGADGNMYMYPTNANTGQNIIKITTSNNTASTISAGTNGWWGMILAPNGNIYGIPARTMTNVLVLNTTTGTRTTITGTTNGYWGGVLAPNGKIYCIPGPSVAIIDPVAGTITPNAVSGGGQANGYFGGVLGWDGNIYCIPSGTTVGVINPNTNTFTTFASNSVFYSGGCLGPDGKIYCIPRSGGAIGVINIATQSFSASSLSLPTGATYNGATLAPSGIIYVSPYTSGSLIYKITFSGLSLSPYLNLCLTPYINKF